MKAPSLCRASLPPLFVSVVFILAVVAGCAQRPQNIHPARFYPIGICGAGRAENLPILRDAGFNLVLGPANRGYLDTALTNQVAVLVSSLHDKEVQARQDVERFDHHPAVWAWFLEDEPEMKGIPPARIFARHQLVKSSGGQKPTVVVLFKGYEALDYGNIADIAVCDRYPIPWLPLCNFGQHLRMVRLALGKEKPLIAIIQAFDWRYYAEQMDQDPARMRPPTYDEIRCMTYCALAQRVNGLMYYAYDDGPGRWRMQEHPETWQALCRVVKEVNRRLPLFQAEHVWWPKDQEWQDRHRRYNAALESSIDSVLLRVTAGNAAIPTGCYVLGVNNTDQQHVYSFTVPFRIAGKVSVFEESRDLAAQNGWLTDTFAPYAVHVYGPLLRVGN